MIRSTPEGSFVWFQLVSDNHRKITWPLELFLAYVKTSSSDAAARCALFDAGEITLMTDQDRWELDATRPFEKTKIAGGQQKAVAARA